MADLNEYNATLTSKNRELTRLTNVQKMALDQKDERIKNTLTNDAYVPLFIDYFASSLLVNLSPES